MKRILLLLFFAFTFSPFSYGFYFRSYQVDDGLSHNNVWAVMQDSRGFIWFGTNDGLNRFDGKTFKIYKKRANDETSIGSNFIHCIKEDSKGRLFIGTKQGLYIFNMETEQFQAVDLLRDPNDEASINSLLEDPDGNIWVACHGQGLYLLDSGLQVKKHYYKEKDEAGGIPSNYIWSIVLDYTGEFWLGSGGGGLIEFDSKEELFTQIGGGHPLKLTDPVVYSLYCDIDNNIWIGTASSGLYRYNPRTGKANRYMGGEAYNIKSIIEYSEKELIMGSDKGLVTFNRLDETVGFLNTEYDNMTDNSIFSITKDKEGAFWIGTYFGGVNYFSPMINRFSYQYNTPANSTKKNIISSFAEDENGMIWVGTYNDGLSLYNPRTLRFEKETFSLGYHDIQDLLLVDGKLYVSLYGRGVAVLDTKTRQVSFPFKDMAAIDPAISSITTLFYLSEGKILFGSEEGVAIYDTHTKRLEKIQELEGVPIKDIEKDYNGSIWFATHANGLLRLNPDQDWDSFTHDPSDSTSIATNNVNCVFQDTKFRIWVGTESEGLMLFNNKTNSFYHQIDEQTGLPSNMIYSILDDSDGNIWVTTGGGLVKIDHDLKSIHTFGYIGDIQKIRYNPKATMRSSNNQLYFGGTNGFISFAPKEIVANSFIPPVIITGFKLSGKEVVPGEKHSPLDRPISETKEIVLDYHQSTFSFDFVSLSYLSPDHNQYAYMLEGFDGDWQYGSNKANYMNIPAGTYLFKVKASNNDDVWSEAETSIRITVKPPVWLSGFMVVLYVILFLAICAYSIYMYNRRIQSQNRKKMYQFKAQKEKEMYESKIHFFTDIAHEIRTPLSLITAPLESILLSGEGTEKTKKNLDIIKINANRLLDLVNQLLDFRKIEDNMFHFNFKRCNLVQIVQDVFNQYYHNADLSNIKMSLVLDADKTESVVDSEAIYKIVSNLISNAIKYARKRIVVEMSSSDNKIFVSVRDDGSGMDEKFTKRIFEPFFQIQDARNGIKSGSGLGLSLSQSLAQKHQGCIRVESKLGEGSLFTLELPIILATSEDVQIPEEIPSEELNPIGIPAATDQELKILIVEDNHDLRAFLKSSLESNSLILEAENGVDALRLIERENLDLIITDIMMPEMDGIELCNEIKTNLAYSHIPVIILSAKTDTPTKIEGLKRGADVYLEKPFSIEQLKAQINSIIENRNKLRENFLKHPLQYLKKTKDTSENEEFIQKLNSYILENLNNDKFTIESLSEYFFMSRSNFHKKIKNITDLTPNNYIKLIRLNQSALLLATGKYKVNEVCYLVGFNTPSYFSKCFQEHFGKLPQEYINKRE
ncbi:response regulator [Parabacteroides sp. OttesenSCG-928-N08]|nr:response regulator [Parabacteroides sp. OttesenSCG-928-N08]